MPRKPAAVQRQPGIHQRHVQRMPHQIIDQHGNPADSQGLVGKRHQFLRGQMMSKQITAEEIETFIVKGKR